MGGRKLVRMGNHGFCRTAAITYRTILALDIAHGPQIHGTSEPLAAVPWEALVLVKEAEKTRIPRDTVGMENRLHAPDYLEVDLVPLPVTGHLLLAIVQGLLEMADQRKAVDRRHIGVSVAHPPRAGHKPTDGLAGIVEKQDVSSLPSTRAS
ncbi:hypothetical protein VTK73DRAFT_4086 [Phialemonium thermophilum]|uniref:Uncharacterized protein n=1 Tax=Phialemonium thermophilum TaxID=223376 RepID=A0ABR3VBR8_9PEZI